MKLNEWLIDELDNSACPYCGALQSNGHNKNCHLEEFLLEVECEIEEYNLIINFLKREIIRKEKKISELEKQLLETKC